MILLDSDDKQFNGFNRLEPARKIFFPVLKEKWQNRNNYIQLYIPNRTAIVLCAEEVLERRGITVNGRPLPQGPAVAATATTTTGSISTTGSVAASTTVGTEQTSKISASSEVEADVKGITKKVEDLKAE